MLQGGQVRRLKIGGFDSQKNLETLVAADSVRWWEESKIGEGSRENQNGIQLFVKF